MLSMSSTGAKLTLMPSEASSAPIALPTPSASPAQCLACANVVTGSGRRVMPVPQCPKTAEPLGVVTISTKVRAEQNDARRSKR